MIDTKLITLLKALSTEEFKEIEKFVASPYFASGRNFTPLLSELKKFYPEFNNRKFNKENLFKKLYPKEIYSPESSDHKIKILFSGLYKLSMDFLVQLGLNKDSERKNYYLLNQLRMKKLDKDYEKLYEEALKDNEHLKGSMFDFMNKIHLHDLNKSYSMAHHDYESTFESSLAMKEYSVITSLINCFRHESEKTIMSAYNLDVRYTLTGNVLENLDMANLLLNMEKNNDKFYPYVRIHYAIHKMEKFRDKTEYFFELRKLMKEYDSLYGRAEKFAIAIMMETYCSHKKRTGDNSLERELFEIYNEMLDKKFFKVSDSESFNIVLFRNMLLNASGLFEYDWMENFIEEYSGELRREHREDMKNYSTAQLNFIKGKFELALENTMKIKFELFLYKIDVKILLLKIYYELNYYEQVYSTLDATLHYLKNTDKLPDLYKKSVRSFLKYLKELTKVISGVKVNVENEIHILKKNIEGENTFNNREWILKKLNDIHLIE